MTLVLFGANRYLLQQRLAEIRGSFVSEHGSEGIEALSGEQIEPGQLASLLTGATLFATNRLVIITNFSQNKLAAERFAQMVGSIPAEIQVVLVENQLDKRTAFYKALKKHAAIEEFSEPDEATTVRWVQEHVAKEGGTIDSSTARYLANYVDSDQLRLKNELEKLIAYDSNITQQSIELLVEKTLQQTVFQLLGLAFSSQTQQALHLLSEMERAHEDPFQLVNMLIWQTHIIAVVASAEGVPDSQVAKDAKLNPFVVQKTRSLAKQLSRSKIRTIIEVVAAADIQLKTSAVDPWRSLELVIAKIS